MKSMRALPLASDEVGWAPSDYTDLLKEMWCFESFLSVKGRTQIMLPWFYRQPFVIDIISTSVREIKIKGEVTNCIKNTSTKGLYIYIA